MSGEIRPVPSGQERIAEAAKHGFTRAIVPKDNAPHKTVPNMQIVPVTSISQIVDLI